MNADSYAEEILYLDVLMTVTTSRDIMIEKSIQTITISGFLIVRNLSCTFRIVLATIKVRLYEGLI